MAPQVTTQANKKPGDKTEATPSVFRQKVVIAFQVEVDSDLGKQLTIIAAKAITHSAIIVVARIRLLYCCAGIPPTALQDTQLSTYMLPDPP